MSVKTKITESFPWTRSTTLAHLGIPAYLSPCYGEFFRAPDYVSEGGRPRWKEPPLDGPLFCAVCARVKGDMRVEVQPLGFLAGWDIAYTGTEDMAK